MRRAGISTLLLWLLQSVGKPLPVVLPALLVGIGPAAEDDRAADAKQANK